MFQRRAASPPAACSTVADALDFCSSVSPGFLDFPPQSQAPCLCYNVTGSGATVWIPNWFDGAVLTCANYIKTADPTDYVTYEALEDYCTSIGNVLEQPTEATVATTPVQTTPPTTTQKQTTGPTTPAPTNTATGLLYPACMTIGSMIASCESAIPTFSALDNAQQASCLCYSGNTWNPDGFDSPILSCANYLQTADPSDYPDASVLVGFCTQYANVQSSQTLVTGNPVTSTTPNTIEFVPTTTANNGQVTVTVRPSSGSSQIGGFKLLILALAAVALDVVILF